MIRVKWSDFNYRCSHSVVRLVPAMLTGKYERIIDSRIVSFDRGYLIWRICLLLEPITNFNKADTIALLEDAIKHLKSKCNTTEKDDSSLNTPA